MTPNLWYLSHNSIQVKLKLLSIGTQCCVAAGISLSNIANMESRRSPVCALQPFQLLPQFNNFMSHQLQSAQPCDKDISWILPVAMQEAHNQKNWGEGRGGDFKHPSKKLPTYCKYWKARLLLHYCRLFALHQGTCCIFQECLAYCSIPSRSKNTS